MQVINWLELEPLPTDLETLGERLLEALPLRNVCQLLVEITLRAYPWTGRTDLISSYHPSQTYEPGQRLALLIPDSQNTHRHRSVWVLAQVKQARMVENPIQGRFQVLTLDTHGRQVQMVGGIPEASYLEPDLSDYTPEDLAWLVDWVSNLYGDGLQATLRRLIQNGQIQGQLAGQTFLPAQTSALSIELLHPFFARLSSTRPWIKLEDILRGLPDLSQLGHETALGLLRMTLKESPYRSLGADRWTTPELFNALDRDVPHGLTTPQLRSKARIWTKRDDQDLAGYGRKFIPDAARRVLEELDSGDSLPEPDDALWRPPSPGKPVRLPTLNYLHLTQAYFSVGDILRLFAPDVQLVFVQFIDRDHQPFLLDRENGLLKAVYPEKLCTRILNDGIPAGTSLWIEYEGHEKYRIAPRRLPFKRMVPCKLAHLENGQLHIQHIQISAMYQGNPSLFKADMHLEEIEALFTEASHMSLSVQDALIDIIEQICATDPDHRAHWLDIFNAVFLRRVCSPSSISFLLYTQPCFEPAGDGYFRYKPTPDGPTRKNRKLPDRLSQLWNDLLANPLPPDPLVKDKISVRPRLEGSVPVSSTFAPDLDFPSHLRGPEPQPELSMTALPLAAVEESTAGNTVVKDGERIESFFVSPDEPDRFTPTQTDETESVSYPWRDSFEKLLHSLVELEEPDAELSIEEASPETEVPLGFPDEAATKESISLASPFRWEPKPAWIRTPVQSSSFGTSPVDPRRFAYRPKIPIRPFHKQRFYRRFIFYLRGWLSGIFRKTP